MLVSLVVMLGYLFLVLPGLYKLLICRDLWTLPWHMDPHVTF
jgi:hypothetical protein